MANLEQIRPDEKASCIAFSIELAKSAIGQERGFVSPSARLGTLSDWEWEKVVMGAMSGWIAERSRQVTSDRLFDEGVFLATGEVPEPYELGLAANVLPGLGDLIERLGLTDKPIGAWSRDEVCLFVWTCADMLNNARARNDERPQSGDDVPDYAMAG